jgi:hypothetical protein
MAAHIQLEICSLSFIWTIVGENTRTMSCSLRCDCPLYVDHCCRQTSLSPDVGTLQRQKRFIGIFSRWVRVHRASLVVNIFLHSVLHTVQCGLWSEHVTTPHSYDFSCASISVRVADHTRQCQHSHGAIPNHIGPEAPRYKSMDNARSTQRTRHGAMI